MLIRLLRHRLRAYGGLVAVVVVLQLVQAVANLYLPSLNADIIDDGVAKGDTGVILRLGGIMLAITLVQVASAIGAVYAGARVAMSIGRDLRAGVFDHVQTFSARELGRFGAPSLITRTTNDVMQRAPIPASPIVRMNWAMRSAPGPSSMAAHAPCPDAPSRHVPCALAAPAVGPDTGENDLREELGW